MAIATKEWAKDLMSKVLKKKLNNYSSEEQKVGTWIDGKPLYQKTIETVSPSQGATSSIYDISDISYDTIFIKDGFLKNSDGRTPLTLGEEIKIWINDERSTIPNVIRMSVSNNASYGSKPVYITIQYTKTTD